MAYMGGTTWASLGIFAVLCIGFSGVALSGTAPLRYPIAAGFAVAGGGLLAVWLLARPGDDRDAMLVTIYRHRRATFAVAAVVFAIAGAGETVSVVTTRDRPVAPAIGAALSALLSVAAIMRLGLRTRSGGFLAFVLAMLTLIGGWISVYRRGPVHPSPANIALGASFAAVTLFAASVWLTQGLVRGTLPRPRKGRSTEPPAFLLPKDSTYRPPHRPE